MTAAAAAAEPKSFRQLYWEAKLNSSVHSIELGGENSRELTTTSKAKKCKKTSLKVDDRK
ncbi:hypothetical protein TYRP_016292 [Tyrophagus putrescentiae]|nr:hypothetical protein TYRP_016292 [Tyrophagus putrescentiae]